MTTKHQMNSTSNKSIVGDLINFRGLVYSPINEQGVVFSELTPRWKQTRTLDGSRKTKRMKTEILFWRQQCRIVAELDVLQAEVDALKHLQTHYSGLHIQREHYF